MDEKVNGWGGALVGLVLRKGRTIQSAVEYNRRNPKKFKGDNNVKWNSHNGK
ncbi:MAG: hypothetical protein ACYS4W_07945 [Planctomycetota bacterium]